MELYRPIESFILNEEKTDYIYMYTTRQAKSLAEAINIFKTTIKQPFFVTYKGSYYRKFSNNA
jgi:hypothetical protein